MKEGHHNTNGDIYLYKDNIDMLKLALTNYNLTINGTIPEKDISGSSSNNKKFYLTINGNEV